MKPSYLLLFILESSLVYLQMLCHVQLWKTLYPMTVFVDFRTKYELNLFMNSWTEWFNCSCSWCVLFPLGDCWRIIWQWRLCWTCIQRTEIGWQGKVFAINLIKGSNKSSTQSLIRFSPAVIFFFFNPHYWTDQRFQRGLQSKTSLNWEAVNDMEEGL